MADNADEMMFCHQCENRWAKVGEDLHCPRCHSDFTEIVRLPSPRPSSCGRTAFDSLLPPRTAPHRGKLTTSRKKITLAIQRLTSNHSSHPAHLAPLIRIHSAIIALMFTTIIHSRPCKITIHGDQIQMLEHINTLLDQDISPSLALQYDQEHGHQWNLCQTPLCNCSDRLWRPSRHIRPTEMVLLGTCRLEQRHKRIIWEDKIPGTRRGGYQEVKALQSSSLLIFKGNVASSSSN